MVYYAIINRRLNQVKNVIEKEGPASTSLPGYCAVPLTGTEAENYKKLLGEKKKLTEEQQTLSGRLLKAEVDLTFSSNKLRLMVAQR